MSHKDSSQTTPPKRRGPMGGGHPGMGAMLPSEKAGDFKGTLRRLLSTLRPHRAVIIIIFVLAIFSTAFTILAPKVLARAFDIIGDAVIMRFATGSGDLDYTSLLRILLIVAGIYLFSAFFNWLTHYTMAGVSQKVSFSMRQDIDKKLAKLPLSFYDKTPRGEILSRVSNDMDNIAMTLQQGLTQLISSITMIIGILIMMLTISPLLTLISVVTLPLAALLTARIAQHSQKQFSRLWETTGTLNGHIEEMFTGHQVVTIFNRQDKAAAFFEVENEKLYRSSYKAHFISGIVMPAMNVLNNLGYVILCVVGGIRMVNGQMSIGDITAFITYSKQFTMPITQTSSILNTMQSTIASAERVYNLLDEQEETSDAPASDFPEKTRGEIEFIDVDFSYLPDEPLISNMNLHVSPGQTVAIVGPTGAGKTTLVNLLLRFYDIQSGAILLDGIDIRRYPRDVLRSYFGMVLQDTWLFSGSIRDNLMYGVGDHVSEIPDETAMISAAKAAYVNHFVKTLPDGYDTILSDQATSLSQGQKQLLTIARSFLANPSILILDEATSSVDTRTELLIQKAMSKLSFGRTSFVIAHRLSTIKDADTILVMNEGKIVEQGNHETLLAAKGFYHDLYHSQFRSELDEAI